MGLLDFLFKPNMKKVRRKVEAMRIRVAKGEEDLGSLLKELRKKSPLVKKAVLTEMASYGILAPAPGRRGGPREEMVSELIDLLHHEWDSIRQQAMACLGTTGSKRALKPLTDILSDTDSLPLHGDVIEALGGMLDKEVVPVLADLFPRVDESQQWSIARVFQSYAQENVFKGEDYPQVSEVLVERVEKDILSGQLGPVQLGTLRVPVFTMCLHALSEVEARSSRSSSGTVKRLASLLPAFSRLALADRSQRGMAFSFVVVFENADKDSLRWLREALDSGQYVMEKERFEKILA